MSAGNISKMFSGEGQDVWHNEKDRTQKHLIMHGADVIGEIVDGTLTSEEALVKGGLDWIVEKHPLFARIPVKQYDGGETDDVRWQRSKSFAIVRKDTGVVVGEVGADYEPIQNHTGFKALDTLAANGIGKFTTAGCLDSGSTVWMQMLAGDSIYVAGDELKPYFLATTSHNGTSQMHFRNCTKRVVCENTLGIAMGENVSRKVSIPHTASGHEDLKKIGELLDLIKNSTQAFKDESDRLLNASFTRSEFHNLALTLVPEPDKSSPTWTQRQTHNWEVRFLDVMKCYDADDLENMVGTKLQAYNAIADYEQHVMRTKGTSLQRAERLFRRSFLEPKLTSAAWSLINATPDTAKVLVTV